MVRAMHGLGRREIFLRKVKNGLWVSEHAVWCYRTCSSKGAQGEGRGESYSDHDAKCAPCADYVKDAFLHVASGVNV